MLRPRLRHNFLVKTVLERRPRGKLDGKRETKNVTELVTKASNVESMKTKTCPKGQNKKEKTTTMLLHYFVKCRSCIVWPFTTMTS